MNQENELSLFLKESTSQKSLVFGNRASTLLASHLKDLKKRSLFGNKIGVPAILCHAPVAAIIEANWEPFFLEVDKSSGQVSESSIVEAVEQGVRCFLWVHMYGNPHISENYENLSKNSDFYIIEDCCLSLGAKINNKWTGSIGDASIFSFGETKPFNIGGGGALALKSEFKALEIESYPNVEGSAFREKFYKKMIHFKKTGDSNNLKGLVDEYIPYLGEVTSSGDIQSFDKKAYFVKVSKRLENSHLYESLLKEAIKPIPNLKGSIPWRFIFRVEGIDGKKQYELSEKMRKEGIDVSNWYLPAHLMVSTKANGSSSLSESEIFSNEVFQLWVDESHDQEKIKKNCKKILEILKEEL